MQTWITGYIKQLSHKKQWVYNHAHETSNIHCAMPSKECQYECHAAFNKHIHNLIDFNKDVVTKIIIKSKKQDYAGIGALIYQSKTYTDSKDKANLFVNYFSSLFTYEVTSHIPRNSAVSLLQIHVDDVAHLFKILIHTRLLDLMIYQPVFE